MSVGESSATAAGVVSIGEVVAPLERSLDVVAQTVRATDRQYGIAEGALRDAEESVRDAEEALQAAQQQVEATHLVLTSFEQLQSQAEATLAQETRVFGTDAAKAIIGTDGLDPAEQTTAALVYNNHSLQIGESRPADYRKVVAQQMRYLDVIRDRLMPGEPVLMRMEYFDQGFAVGTVTEEGLEVESSRIIGRPSPGGERIVDGTIGFHLANGAYVRGKVNGLVDVVQQEVWQQVVDSRTTHSGQFIRQLAANSEPLVIGGEAVASAANRLPAARRFVVAAAFHAMGVQVPPIDLGTRLQKSMSRKLAEIVAFRASPIGREWEGGGVPPNMDDWDTLETKRSRDAYSVDWLSIRGMLGALGIDRETIKDAAYAVCAAEPEDSKMSTKSMKRKVYRTGKRPIELTLDYIFDES